jgi:hypothetical protein
MDPTQFDRLTKSLTRAATRRSALAGILAGAVSTFLPLIGEARRQNKKTKRKRRNRRNEPGKALQPEKPPQTCLPGSSCIVEEAASLRNCDLSGSSVLREANCIACSLDGANLLQADASGAKLGAASLNGACLVLANLFGADVDGASFNNAIFCGTIMPDGSINDSGCDRTDECCQTPECPGGICPQWDGCTPLENLCVPIVGRPCCPHAPCSKIIPTKNLSPTACQSNECASDAQCAGWFPRQDVYCEKDPFKCNNWRASCCLRKTCRNNDDCPHSLRCCLGSCCVRGQVCTPTGCYGGV